jgi:hypothetical protein
LSNTEETDVKNLIEKAFSDEITDLLLKKSNLTRIQLETFIIDILSDILSSNRVSFHEKAQFRNKKVSRGSFSRTLSQARSRVISSVMTIILLNYIGIFDNTIFDDFRSLAEKLRDYLNSSTNSKEKLSSIQFNRIENELIEGIITLSKPTSIKNM